MVSASRFVHEYTKSVFAYREPLSGDYTVYLNGEEIPVYTCRISQYPFNTVWPGHQRPFDQSEEAAFVNIVSDEPVTLSVVAHRPHERVLLKPYSKGIVPTEKNGIITFVLPQQDNFVLETDDYHHCLYIFNSRPIPCPDPASVTHYFGPGVHMPGKITLHSNESVYVDKDALVFGCLFAEDAENIRIFGNGLLDDSGEERFSAGAYEAYTNGNLKFYDCKNLRIEGVLFRNSAMWCVNLFHCTDVTLDNIRVFGQWRYNTDGLDIVNCQHILCRHSFIHSFDDTVTIKGILRYADTDNVDIRIEGCTLWCDWGKTCEVGVETLCCRMRDIVFENCDILRAGNTALDIHSGNCAEISDIVFRDIRVEYNAFDTKEVYQQTDDMIYGAEDTVATPWLIRLRCSPWGREALAVWGVPDTLGGLDLTGIRQQCVHGVTVDGVRVYYDERIPLTDGRPSVPIGVESQVPGATISDVHITDISVNGVPLTRQTALWQVPDDPDVTDIFME